MKPTDEEIKQKADEEALGIIGEGRRVYSEAYEDGAKWARDKALEEVNKAIDEVKADYPEDLFPPDGGSEDRKNAELIRFACERVKNKVNEIENKEV